MPIMVSALLCHDGHAYCKTVVKAQLSIRLYQKCAAVRALHKYVQVLVCLIMDSCPAGLRKEPICSSTFCICEEALCRCWNTKLLTRDRLWPISFGVP